jgi:hypothetical protein
MAADGDVWAMAAVGRTAAMIRRPTIAYNRHQSIHACSICGVCRRRLPVAWRRLFAVAFSSKCVKSAIITHFFMAFNQLHWIQLTWFLPPDLAASR